MDKIEIYEAAIRLSDEGEVFFYTDEDKKTVLPAINCGDTFAYACADSEDFLWTDAPYIWEQYKEKGWPFLIEYISIKRGGIKPIRPVEEYIKKYKHEKIITDKPIKEVPDHLDKIKVYEDFFYVSGFESLDCFFSKDREEITPSLLYYDKKKKKAHYYEIEWEHVKQLREIHDKYNYEEIGERLTEFAEKENLKSVRE